MLALVCEYIFVVVYNIVHSGKLLAFFSDYGYGSDDSGSNKKPIIIGSGGTTGSNGLNYSPDIVHQTQALMMHQHPAPPPGGQRIQHANGPMVCYDYSYPDSNSNHTSKSSSGSTTGPANLNASILRPVSEHHYEQPMVVFNGQMVAKIAAQSPSDSVSKPPRSESGTSSSTSTNDRNGQGKPQ